MIGRGSSWRISRAPWLHRRSITFRGASDRVETNILLDTQLNYFSIRYFVI